MKLWKWFRTLLSGRPHFKVGGDINPYLLRWYILPRNRWFNIYLHKFVRDDDDRALHDHPWRSLSILIRGRYLEQTASGWKLFRVGSFIYRNETYAHRVELPGGKPCWTLFFTGPKLREWGFHCPKGWVVWTDFVDQHDYGNTGKGCGES